MSNFRSTWLSQGLILALALLLCWPSHAADPRDEIKQVVTDMNAAWMDQDVSKCLSYFTQDADFENSFGWSFRDRNAFGRFLQWLFDRYPNDESAPAPQFHESYAVEMLTETLAMVESIRSVESQDAAAPARHSRAMYLVRKEAGAWLIWKTRIWEPKSSNALPDELIGPNRFERPDVDHAPLPNEH